MADPATIFSIINCSSSLMSQCVKVAKELHDLAERYKHAELEIVSAAEQCEIIRLAWQRIGTWCEHWAEPDEELLQRLQRSGEVGNMMLSALEDDLSLLQVRERKAGFRRRARIVWDESLFQSHQNRIKDQVVALNLLLTVVEL